MKFTVVTFGSAPLTDWNPDLNSSPPTIAASMHSTPSSLPTRTSIISYDLGEHLFQSPTLSFGH